MVTQKMGGKIIKNKYMKALRLVSDFIYIIYIYIILGFPAVSDGKESACNAGDMDLIPGSGRPLENGKAIHHNILENTENLEKFYIHICMYIKFLNYTLSDLTSKMLGILTSK